MSTKIFVNLPVKDLDTSIEFFTQLGFSFNPQFSDADASCLVISDDIYAMLLVESFFKTFTDKDIIDATKGTEVILALSVDSRLQVDELVDKALAAGGLPGVGLENSMQRPDLRSSCADRSWMIVGCCRCQSCTGSCAVCWV